MSNIEITNKYKFKPTVSWYNYGDPTQDMDYWTRLITEINIIETRNLTPEFIEFCLSRRDYIFLHVKISGMGASPLEPNIPTPKAMFLMLKSLVDRGFPRNRILICVDPIIANSNGIRAIKLLLRVFTELKELRLRYMRVKLISYTLPIDGIQMVASRTLRARLKARQIEHMFSHGGEGFIREYFNLLKEYEPIINVDKGELPLIGERELQSFGISNSWMNPDGSIVKIVNYENNNKFKPILKVISKEDKIKRRCKNVCVLCPFKD